MLFQVIQRKRFARMTGLQEQTCLSIFRVVFQKLLQRSDGFVIPLQASTGIATLAQD